MTSAHHYSSCFVLRLLAAARDAVVDACGARCTETRNVDPLSLHNHSKFGDESVRLHLKLKEFNQHVERSVLSRQTAAFDRDTR